MNILYATDGSGGARTAGRLLASLPLPADTQVTVLSALDHDLWAESMIFTDTSVQEHRRARGLAEQHADEGAALLSPCGWRVARSLGGEEAAVAILHRAEADGADLIVLGSHNRHGMERVVIGSVSEHVARYAHTSVLVARNDAVKRVMIAIDGSASSEHALDALAHLPLPAGTSLTLLYVAPVHERPRPAPQMSALGDETQVTESESEAPGVAEQIIAHAAQRLRAGGRRADLRLGCGHPAEQILAAAREMEADLVVVGSANRSVLGRLVAGSVSGRVLSHAPCSVLVARPTFAPARAEVFASGVASARV
jgi:nucleotide-binding universal stress UspA family protein